MIDSLLPPIGPALLKRLHVLNEAHAVELSSLTTARLAQLITTAFAAYTAGDGDALLLAFDQDGDYDSPNFLWFRERLARFVYVDRVVVSQTRRGEGLARQFYEKLFDAARTAGHDRVVCEVNFDPPNPASDLFHERLGFAEVGRAHLADRGKGVRYLSCAI